MTAETRTGEEEHAMRPCTRRIFIDAEELWFDLCLRRRVERSGIELVSEADAPAAWYPRVA